MVKVTIDNTPEEIIPEGVYHAEVVSVEVKTSRAGQQMMALVHFKETTHGQPLCTDIMMLEGKGVRFAVPRLHRLGVECSEGEFEIETDELIGKRCYLEIYHEVFNGEKRPKPKQDGGERQGYWPDGDPPEGHEILVIDPQLPF